MLVCQLFDCLSQCVYTKKTEHSRAMILYQDTLYLGSNLGNVYLFTLEGNTIKLNQKLIQQEKELFPEIRDIARMDNNRLVIMQTGSTSSIQFMQPFAQPKKINKELLEKGIFLDGFDFQGKFGFLMGDPVKENFSLFISKNYGKKWTKIKNVKSSKGEAAFAASGSTVKIFENKLFFVSGGMQSRLFHSKKRGRRWQYSELPIEKCQSCGINSMEIFHHKDKVRILLVGGDFNRPDRKENSCIYSDDFGESWKISEQPPNGYRSKVLYDEQNKTVYCGGTNGIDYSKDFGRTWHPLVDEHCYNFVLMDNFLVISSKEGSLKLVERIN